MDPLHKDSTTNVTPISTESTKIASKNPLPETIFTTEESHKDYHDYGIDLVVVNKAVNLNNISAEATTIPLTKAEEEAQLKAEAQKKVEEEAQLKAEAKKKAEEEARLKAEAEAQKKAEEEAQLKAKAEAKKKAEEEAGLKAEADAKRKAAEEIRLKAEAEAFLLYAEAKAKATEEARLKAEEEEARIQAEQDAKRLAEEEPPSNTELEENKLKYSEGMFSVIRDHFTNVIFKFIQPYT